MRLSDIEKKAKNVGVKDTWKYGRRDLIRLIQQAEGNTVCFGTASGSCVHMGCCWRQDCLR